MAPAKSGLPAESLNSEDSRGPIDLKAFGLSGRTALITGGTSGIGLSTAQWLKAAGARVAIVGRDQQRLQAACESLENTAPENGEVMGLRGDVSRPEQIEKIITACRENFGQLDILFANAGVSDCPPLLAYSEADFDAMVDINFKGVFFSFVKALPLLAARASVILTASAAHDMGKPGDPLYSATKAAVRSLGRTFAADPDVLARGIRVNVLSPGAIRTPLTQQNNPHMQALIDEYIQASVPMKRWGEAEEIAKAALFLASPLSSYMTGAEVAVDGGLGQI